MVTTREFMVHVSLSNVLQASNGNLSEENADQSVLDIMKFSLMVNAFV